MTSKAQASARASGAAPAGGWLELDEWTGEGEHSVGRSAESDCMVS